MVATIPYPEPPLGVGTFVLRGFRAADFPFAKALEEHEGGSGRIEVLPAVDGEGMERACEESRQEGVLQLVIADVGRDAYLGEITLVLLEPGTAELGCAIAPEARGRHLATDAVNLLSTWALEALGLRRLQVLVDVQHGAALKAAENAGYQREGVLRAYREVDGVQTDAVLLSRLPGDAVA